MDYETFVKSVSEKSAPDSQLSLPLQALWWERKGDWDKAHARGQEAGSQEGDRVHAYLHRREGDEGNASYWYRRANSQKPNVSLDEEWQHLAEQLLDQP